MTPEGFEIRAPRVGGSGTQGHHVSHLACRARECYWSEPFTREVDLEAVVEAAELHRNQCEGYVKPKKPRSLHFVRQQNSGPTG